MSHKNSDNWNMFWNSKVPFKMTLALDFLSSVGTGGGFSLQGALV